MSARFAATPLIVLFAALALAAPARADSGDLTSAEKSALRTIEKELIKLAKYATRGKDYAAAKAELLLALEVDPENDKARRELQKVEKRLARGNDPRDGFADKLAEEREEAHAAVSLALAEAALATEEEAPARYRRYLELIQTRFPSQEALDKLDLGYFEPYIRWVSATEKKLLESGGEVVDGEHLDATAVEALNRRHSSWSDPWVVSDEVHEVRTTMPLRTAKQILAHVTSYRAYFLSRFGALWDLQPPTGKLPIIVTQTQRELTERVRAEAGPQGAALANQGIQGAAFYLQTNGKLNPCFVTYEPKEATGMVFKIERFEQVIIPLVHEVTHQIAFEYSKHDYDNRRQIQHHFWSVEAIANFMGYHVFDGKGWKLTHPRTIPMGHGMIEGPFAYCVTNKGSLPPLRQFMGQTHQQFMTVQNYHIAATLAYFLLEGEGGKYRASFCKLLQAVHRVRDTADAFEQAFPGVDANAMQSEWLRFVSSIELDD